MNDRLARQTAHLPMVVTNVAAAGAEVQTIGRHQATIQSRNGANLANWMQDSNRQRSWRFRMTSRFRADAVGIPRAVGGECRHTGAGYFIAMLRKIYVSFGTDRL